MPRSRDTAPASRPNFIRISIIDLLKCPGCSILPERKVNGMNPAHYIVCGLLLARPLAAEADSWPMFRGAPALTGVSASTLPDKPKLLWTFKTAGPVKSSAAIADGRAIVGSGDSNLYAINLADGKKQWTYKTGGAIENTRR